jgi:DNA-binding response OmpR family regulator
LPTLSISGLSLDPATRTAQATDQSPKRLTHLEFRLLYTLMIHNGQVIPTETIVEQVWGYDGRGDKELVRGLVRRLRAKIEPEPHEPRYILTTPGVGYCFASNEE